MVKEDAGQRVVQVEGLPLVMTHAQLHLTTEAPACQAPPRHETPLQSHATLFSKQGPLLLRNRCSRRKRFDTSNTYHIAAR